MPSWEWGVKVEPGFSGVASGFLFIFCYLCRVCRFSLMFKRGVGVLLLS